MKNRKALLLVGLVALVSVQCWAAGDTNTLTIKRLYMRDLGIKIYPEGVWTNPDGCKSAESLVLDANHPKFDLVASAILAAKASGTPVSAYVNGCFTWFGNDFPKIEGFHVK